MSNSLCRDLYIITTELHVILSCNFYSLCTCNYIPFLFLKLHIVVFLFFHVHLYGKLIHVIGLSTLFRSFYSENQPPELRFNSVTFLFS